ncbi:MAG: hypothetical protein R3F62_05420 [Planctomycetota bacterium]
MNGLLVVLALTAWVRFRRSGRPGWCALSSLSFLAAFGAKYTAASFPLALLALDLTVLRDPRRTWAQRTVPLLPACAIAGGMTLLAITLGAEHATIKPAPGHGLRFVSNDPILLLHAAFGALASHGYAPTPSGPCARPTALTALGLLAFLALAGGSWAARRRAPLLALGGALWLVFLLPVSNLVPKGLWFAERYLFLPSLGLACAVAWLWSACRGPDPRRRAARLLLALWLFGLGALTALRLPVWRDSVTLWTTTLAHPWGNPAGYDQLGLYYLTVAHEPATAQRVFEDGLRELTARGTLRTQLGIELRYHRLLCVILAGDLTSARIEWQQLQAACLASADPRSRPASWHSAPLLLPPRARAAGAAPVNRPLVALIVGTRPEAIKLAPLYRAEADGRSRAPWPRASTRSSWTRRCGAAPDARRVARGLRPARPCRLTAASPGPGLGGTLAGSSRPGSWSRATPATRSQRPVLHPLEGCAWPVEAGLRSRDLRDPVRGSGGA